MYYFDKLDNASFWAAILGESEVSDRNFHGFEEIELRSVTSLDEVCDSDFYCGEWERNFDAEKTVASASEDGQVGEFVNIEVWLKHLDDVTVEPFQQHIGPSSGCHSY